MTEQANQRPLASDHRARAALWLLAAALAVVVAVINYRLWLPAEGGFRQLSRLQSEVAKLESENAELTLRNNALLAEVESLEDGMEAIEERARSALGMIRPGETLYRLLEPDTSGRTRN